MAFVQNFPFFSIMITMVAGVVCAVLKPKLAQILTMLTLIAVTCMSFAVLVFTLRTGESFVYWMGHFPAPFGNEIRAGALEALMAAAFGVVMFLSIAAGMSHLEEDIDKDKQNYAFLMLNLLFSSMLALIYTNDIFTAYVFVEINTLTGCAIVMAKKTKETLVATVRYLIMSLLGSGLFLIGICIIYDITGHLLMSNIKDSVADLVSNQEYMIPLEGVIGLFIIAMGIKSALYPFHIWLPDAHGSATSPVSGILSGLVLKAYIILLIKIFYRVIGIDVINESRVLSVLFVMGLVAMVMGSVNAIKERDIKRMVAYSSVAQIGYIYSGIGIGAGLGMMAACLHIIVHAITKPMLFAAAGGFMEVSRGSQSFDDIKGAARRNPVAGIAFTVGTLSMIGIPLTAGFASKLYLSMSFIGVSSSPDVMTWKMVLGLAALIVSTVLNALYYIPVIMLVYSGGRGSVQTWRELSAVEEEPEEVENTHKSNLLFTSAMIVFIVLNIALGVGFRPIADIINQGIAMLG